MWWVQSSTCPMENWRIFCYSRIQPTTAKALNKTICSYEPNQINYVLNTLQPMLNLIFVDEIELIKWKFSDFTYLNFMYISNLFKLLPVYIPTIFCNSKQSTKNFKIFLWICSKFLVTGQHHVGRTPLK